MTEKNKITEHQAELISLVLKGRNILTLPKGAGKGSGGARPGAGRPKKEKTQSYHRRVTAEQAVELDELLNQLKSKDHAEN